MSVCLDNGEKAFTCTICSKKFSLEVNIKMHQKIQSEEKLFCCLVCDKTFERACDLKGDERRIQQKAWSIYNGQFD